VKVTTQTKKLWHSTRCLASLKGTLYSPRNVVEYVLHFEAPCISLWNSLYRATAAQFACSYYRACKCNGWSQPHQQLINF
jgi:hypothetical protein